MKKSERTLECLQRKRGRKELMMKELGNSFKLPVHAGRHTEWRKSWNLKN